MMDSSRYPPLLKVENLTKHYPVGGGFFTRANSFIQAVDGINFSIYPGKSLALVGESGCGKTTTGKLLVRLFEPTSGHIFLKNPQGELEDIATLKGKEIEGISQPGPNDFSGSVRIAQPAHDGI